MLRDLRFGVWSFLAIWILGFGICSAADLFQDGTTAYRSADYVKAATAFRQSCSIRPASGTLQNLGNAEWQRNRFGPAILAWEQSLWLDSFNRDAHTNLRFARKNLQLEAPELTWYEMVSTWLPVNYWSWVASLSFWLAVAATLLPGIFRLPKAGWQQAVAALSLTVFLLSLPALIGVRSRSHLGFVLAPDTPLRKTPTAEADTTPLAAGEAARVERTRRDYLLIRTSHASGWIRAEELGMLCPRRS